VLTTRIVAAAATAFVGLSMATGVAGAAGPPASTPAGTGGGCRDNGQAISTVARLQGPFGVLVRSSAPIADDNVQFFATICNGAG
jgi:hypothetical protein